MFLKNEDLDQRFDYHPPKTIKRQDEHAAARMLVKDVAIGLSELLPAGREAALAMTHLEEALFWANAAIARQP